MTARMAEEVFMKNLLELCDKDVGWKSKPVVRYGIRRAARVVVFRGSKMALLHTSKHGYYKLIGGGMERGESIKKALEREVLEEIGCKFKVTGEVGKIIEYRTHQKIKQINFCYIGKVTKTRKPSLTQEEIDKRFKQTWVPLNKAITLVKNSRTDKYEGRFIVKRDQKFLEKAKEILSAPVV